MATACCESIECVRALEWARIDEALFSVFWRCVGPQKQCAIIYYRINSMHGRFLLTNEIVRSVLPARERQDGGHDHPSVKAWDAARQGWDSLLTFRRRIAHHRLAIELAPPSPDLTPDMLVNFIIRETEGENLKRGQSQTPIRVDDLRKHAAELADLLKRLLTFYRNVLLAHV